jgi:hypothetical protein
MHLHAVKSFPKHAPHLRSPSAEPGIESDISETQAICRPGLRLAGSTDQDYCYCVTRSAIRFAVTWLAVWCQVFVVATMPFVPLAMAADPLGDIPICHAADPGEAGRPSPSPKHDQHDCALCVMCCQMHAPPVSLLPPTSTLPVQQAVAIIRHYAAQPRAPPIPTILAARPRGPPSLI